MRLSDKELKGLPVHVRSGGRIGKLIGVIVDTETMTVASFAVARSRSLPSIMPKELLVHPSQVVSIDARMMIVDDAAAVEPAKQGMRVPNPSPSVGGVSPRSME